jgi:O-antigen/teichoic acid export membrane protein
MYGTFNAAVAGQYALVERSLMLPVGMIGGAVAQVFTADLSARIRTDSNQGAAILFRKTVKQMFVVGAFPTVIVGILAPTLFAKLFGPNWILAGELARIMAPLALVAFATMTVNMTILILGWQKVQLSWEILRLVFTVATWLCINGLKLTPTAAISLHVITSIIMSASYLMLADRMLCRHGVKTA